MKPPCQTVLYVDDDEGNRTIFEATFADKFEIVMCNSADEAIQILERREIALLLTDQRMPGRTGNALLSEVRNRFPTTIRMLLTAHADIKAILTSVNENLVTRYFIKPWDEDEITEALRWGLEAYALASTPDGGALQARLLETERLTTLGAVQASFLHELGQPIAYLTLCSEELGEFSSILPALRTMLSSHPLRNEEEHKHAEHFLSEFPSIQRDLRSATELLGSLRDDVDTLLLRRQSEGVAHADGEAILRSIRFSVAMNKVEASMAGVDVRFVQEDGLPSIAIQPEQLTQVLVNLIRNSVQCFGDSRRPRKIRIETDLSAAKDALHVSVTDTGPGMSPDELSRVGRQFYSTRTTGTGLGIFTSRSVLERCGGSLEITSTEGQGTRATMSLPLT